VLPAGWGSRAGPPVGGPAAGVLSLPAAAVQGLVKNARIVNENFKDGLYKVNMELKIDEDKWREVFSY